MLLDNFQLFACSARYRRWRGGPWYQVWVPLRYFKLGGTHKLVWRTKDADRSKGERTNEFEVYQNSVTHA